MQCRCNSQQLNADDCGKATAESVGGAACRHTTVPHSVCCAVVEAPVLITSGCGDGRRNVCTVYLTETLLVRTDRQTDRRTMNKQRRAAASQAISDGRTVVTILHRHSSSSKINHSPTSSSLSTAAAAATRYIMATHLDAISVTLWRTVCILLRKKHHRRLHYQ